MKFQLVIILLYKYPIYVVPMYPAMPNSVKLRKNTVKHGIWCNNIAPILKEHNTNSFEYISIRFDIAIPPAVLVVQTHYALNFSKIVQKFKILELAPWTPPILYYFFHFKLTIQCFCESASGKTMKYYNTTLSWKIFRKNIYIPR